MERINKDLLSHISLFIHLLIRSIPLLLPFVSSLVLLTLGLFALLIRPSRRRPWGTSEGRVWRTGDQSEGRMWGEREVMGLATLVPSSLTITSLSHPRVPRFVSSSVLHYPRFPRVMRRVKEPGGDWHEAKNQGTDMSNEWKAFIIRFIVISYHYIKIWP